MHSYDSLRLDGEAIIFGMFLHAVRKYHHKFQGLIFKILLLASPPSSKFVLFCGGDDPDKDFCVNWKYEEGTPSFSFQVALHSCAESR